MIPIIVALTTGRWPLSLGSLAPGERANGKRPTSLDSRGTKMGLLVGTLGRLSRHLLALGGVSDPRFLYRAVQRGARTARNGADGVIFRYAK